MEFDFTRFVDLGVAGMLVVWFMLRLEKILNRLDKTVQLVAGAITRLLEHVDAGQAASLSDAVYKANSSNEG